MKCFFEIYFNMLLEIILLKVIVLINHYLNLHCILNI